MKAIAEFGMKMRVFIPNSAIPNPKSLMTRQMILPWNNVVKLNKTSMLRLTAHLICAGVIFSSLYRPE